MYSADDRPPPPESVRLIYNSGTDVPMNLLCSQQPEWSWVCGCVCVLEGKGSYCWSVISPAGVLSGVCDRGEEIDKEEETTRD